MAIRVYDISPDASSPKQVCLMQVHPQYKFAQPSSSPNQRAYSDGAHAQVRLG